MATWEEFRRSVRIATHKKLRPTSDADLDAFEKLAGLKLPPSYRKFAKIFGACVLGRQEYMIAVPSKKMKMKVDRQRFELTTLSQEMHEIVEASTRPVCDKVYAVNPKQSLRMVFFATDGGDATFGWDPEDPSDAADHEYAVYVRYTDSHPYDRLASTFEEFVQEYSVKQDRKRRQDLDPSDNDDPRMFLSPR
jgi:hypothetical protein